MTDIETSQLLSVSVDDGMVMAALKDGRTISVPLSWYPFLENAPLDKLNNYKVDGKDGAYVFWPDFNRQIHVNDLLSHVPASFKQMSRRSFLQAAVKLPALTVTAAAMGGVGTAAHWGVEELRAYLRRADPSLIEHQFLSELNEAMAESNETKKPVNVKFGQFTFTVSANKEITSPSR